jgi:hypothetical protein
VFALEVNVNTLALNVFSDAVAAFNEVILADDERRLDISAPLYVNEPVSMGLCIIMLLSL